MPERSELDDIRRQLGDVREDIGELRAGLSGIEKGLARVEGKIDANQLVNQEAHKSQDDRIIELHGKIGEHRGERTAADRIGTKAVAVIAAVCGGVAGAALQALGSVFGRH